MPAEGPHPVVWPLLCFRLVAPRHLGSLSAGGPSPTSSISRSLAVPLTLGKRPEDEVAEGDWWSFW